jgi:hypothetical protein
MTAGKMEPIKTAVARQRLLKRFPAVTNTQATIEPLDVVFATLMGWDGLGLFDVKKADQRQSEIK